MQSDQDIDNALASEFSGYLKSIAKEVVQPIREEASKQKLEIERLNGSIAQAGARIAALLENHRENLSTEGHSLLTALDEICLVMSEIVQGVASANDVTRERLLLEATRLSDAFDSGIAEFRNDMQGMRDALDNSLATFPEKTKPWITQAGREIEAAIGPRISSATAKVRYSIVAMVLLQIGSMALFWFYQ